MNRSRQYYREMREKHIKRKKRLDILRAGAFSSQLMYSCDGKYSKGKIHCSCGLCRAKTNNKSWRKRTIHANYAPNHNWKPSDLRQIQKMNYKDIDIDNIFINVYNEYDFECEDIENMVFIDGYYFDKRFDF